MNSKSFFLALMLCASAQGSKQANNHLSGGAPLASPTVQDAVSIKQQEQLERSRENIQNILDHVMQALRAWPKFAAWMQGQAQDKGPGEWIELLENFRFRAGDVGLLLEVGKQWVDLANDFRANPGALNQATTINQDILLLYWERFIRELSLANSVNGDYWLRLAGRDLLRLSADLTKDRKWGQMDFVPKTQNPDLEALKKALRQVGEGQAEEEERNQGRFGLAGSDLEGFEEESRDEGFDDDGNLSAMEDDATTNLGQASFITAARKGL